MDAWIDTYHAVRRLTTQGTFVFLTDSAVGAQEEDNLRHLVTNLGTDVPRTRIVPFLTTKHSLEYCLSYAERAHHHGFPALVVLGGDKNIGTPRAVEHAWQLRQLLQERDRTLVLGGWANPHADAARQVEYLLAPDFHAEFFLTQVVSHHQIDKAARFIDEAGRRHLTLAGIFGVFYYRSAESPHARGAERVSAGSGRGSDPRVWRGADGRTDLRADDPHAEGCRRETLLHQQPADCSRADRPRGDPGAGINHGPQVLRFSNPAD